MPNAPATAPVVDAVEFIDGVGALLAGTANVIMQLARPEVGYGVLESKVESGQVTRHPLKRFRTTFTYLAVALLGTDDERGRYRQAVNGAHRLVRSDAASPVAYNAFDPHLQLWVAACLYQGTVDVWTALHGPLDDARADALYAHSARFGTTLQVRPELWPADRDAFAAYWADGLTRLRIDPPVRDYLHGLMWRTYLPRPLRLQARFGAWVTTGFLHPPFRAAMGLSWTDGDQRRFERLLRRVGSTSRALPRPLRIAPFNLFLWDLRRRLRRGAPLV